MSLTHRDYTVGCICPMGVELAPVKAMLDHVHPSRPTQRDVNSYILGEMCGHNVVIAVLPEIGTNAAATAAIQLLNDFPCIRFGLLVGIGGGVLVAEDDEEDIRLGDVVISKPTATFGGVVQYDLGKHSTMGGFERTGILNKPPTLLRSSVESLAADHRMKGSRVPQYLDDMLQKFPNMEEEYSYPGSQHDQLFRADYPHPSGATCRQCDVQQIVERDARKNTNPKFHYGTIGSANSVVKDARLREKLRQTLKILCVEMEATGLMDSFPCLVIRGICDYADSHKNKKWQPYAAATAAGYMKELLSIIPPREVASVARAREVIQIPRTLKSNKWENILLPGSDSRTRSILVLGGMGGIGKTQLSLAYAKRHVNAYSSVFWLNADSKVTLQGSLRKLAGRILPPETVKRFDNDRLWLEISKWLCELDNHRWLLIFDNYDNPSEFDIAQHYPAVAHGSIIVTTRVPREVNGSKLDLVPLRKEEDSLQVLSTRSGRKDVDSDVYARRLAKRLDGLPLALATAGAYLKESSWSFSKYLQHYEAQWQAVDSLGLLEDYRTRTLHTTWDISLKSIRQESILAAEFLRFLAYLDPREFWYELFCRRLDRRNGRWPSWYELLHRSRDRRHRLWLTTLTESETSFETAMRTLVKYCLVQVNYQTGSYSIHVCVHDWTMHGLNRQISVDRYWLAFDFVAGYIKLETIDDLSAVQSRKIVPHAERLANERFKDVARRKAFQRPRLLEVSGLGELLLQHYRFGAAERMFAWALAGYKDKVGLDDTYTMIISYNLAKIYIRQDKYNQAEDLLQQALEFFNRAPDGENQRTLQVLSCLGVVYDLQGRVKEAEEIILQALQRKKIMLGIDDESTLHELNNLGVLYLKQMKLDQAAEMFEQARDGYERIPSTRVTAENKLAALGNLGLVYIDQKKLTEAEDIFRQVLQVREIALGAEHTETLNTINHLGYIYAKQGKFDQAEHLNLDVLQVKEKNLGVDHISTLETVSNLGYVYMQQGKSYQAEKMYERVLRGYEKNLGTDLVSTYVPAFDTSWVLGRIYAEMARPVESREMFQRALNGYQKVMGPSHEHCMRLENAIEALDRESPPQRPSMVQDTDPWKTVLIEDDDGQPAVD